MGGIKTINRDEEIAEFISGWKIPEYVLLIVALFFLFFIGPLFIFQIISLIMFWQLYRANMGYVRVDPLGVTISSGTRPSFASWKYIEKFKTRRRRKGQIISIHIITTTGRKYKISRANWGYNGLKVILKELETKYNDWYE